MYSYEKRKKAVDLYLKYDKNASAVIRELEYPTFSMLKIWYRESLENGDLHEKFRSGYSSEQRAEAVKYYKEHGKSLSRTVKALGYPCRQLLGKWVHEDLPSDCHPLKRGRSVVQYTDKQKMDAVVSVASGEKTAKQLEAEIGVTRSAVSLWKRQLLGEGDSPDMAKKHSKESEKDSTQGNITLRAECNNLREERNKLQTQVYKLQMEKDIFEKAAEILKKDEGIGIDKLSNREKAMIIDALTCRYSIKDLLLSLQMAKSSYFYQSDAIKKDKYALVRENLRKAFDENRKCYGYRRLHTVLTSNGSKLSEKVVLRLMHEENLVVPFVKRKKYSSYKGELSPEVENIIKRDFHADNPNEKWLSDITEFSIPAGKVYLSPIVDCFDGHVPSWTRGPSPNAELVNTMLDKAVGTLQEGEHPLVHTDRGCHYRWPGWIERMGDAKLVRSMSKKGCSPDNSACEGFFGRLKNEMFYNRSWSGVSLEEFYAQLDDYICWYNEKRIKLSLGGRSPLDYRRSLGLVS
ncbi:MAG: IS3 family transposase [Sphaerochaeta sp.]|nr:IS3 family transposase [Sphaerochaeta sp.]